MVVILFTSDQPVNAEPVARLGLDSILDYRSVTPVSLKEADFFVLSDKEMQKTVRNMKERIPHVPGNTGAVQTIEEYTAWKA